MIISASNAKNLIYSFRIKHLIALFIIYTLQGTFITLIITTTPIYLKLANISYEEISLYSTAALPFSFKILVGPIIDKYYVPSIGKRKSWIIPLGFLINIILIFFSHYYVQQIQQGSITKLYITSLFLMIFLAFQDISIDGWVVSLLHEKDYAWGGFVQVFGLYLGSFVGFNVMLDVTSADFAKNYFGATDGQPLIQISTFIDIINFLKFAFFIYVAIFIHEMPHENDLARSMSLDKIYKSLINFWRNKNLRLFCFVITMARVLGCFWLSCGTLVMVSDGFPKESIAFIDAVFIPLKLILLYLLTSIRMKNDFSDFEIFVFSWIAFFMQNFFGSLLCLTWYMGLQKTTYVFYYILYFWNALTAVAMVAVAAIGNRWAQENLSGTFITTIWCFWNFGIIFSNIFWDAVIEIIPFYLLAIINMILMILFIYHYFNSVIRLGMMNKTEFLLVKPEILNNMVTVENELRNL